MEPRVSLITLGVRDLERAVAFYRDGLGWPLSGASVEGEVAFLRIGGTVLALWGREALAEDANVDAEGSGFSGFALAHNVAQKEEVDSVLEEALSAGATVLEEAKDVFFGRNGYFADPEGFLWEVAWNPSFPLSEDGSIELPD
ncbi:MAG: VOC family protein [Actinomycetota bacterium]|nr:VOC family protein [Actinomycetota bacterium]